MFELIGVSPLINDFLLEFMNYVFVRKSAPFLPFQNSRLINTLTTLFLILLIEYSYSNMPPTKNTNSAKKANKFNVG